MSYSHILQLALAKPKWVYSIVILMVLASLLMMPQLKIDTDPENMLSANAPERIFHNQTKQRFLMNDMIVVGIVSKADIFTPANLAIVEKLTSHILTIDGVITEDLLSLSVVDNITQEPTPEGNSSIRFEYLMKKAPTSNTDSKALQKSIKRLPMLDNTLVSEDNKAIAIYVPIKSKDMSYHIAEEIRALTSTIETSLNFHITGLPVAEDQFGYEMFVQMGVAAPLAGLAIFVLLYYFFRNFPLIIAPMIVAMATVIIIMGSLIGLGFTVHIMSSMIAIFLMPIAVVDSVHILSEFSDRYNEGDKPNNVITEVMRHLYTPMLYTSITSAVGFYSLMLTPIPPVKIFGAFIGTGILLAFILTITFIPAYISRLSPATLTKLQAAIQRLEPKSKLGTVLERLGGFSFSKAKYVLIGFIVLFAISIQGITRIEINDNPVNWFKPDHQIRVADKVLNQHFAGTYDAWLVFENTNKTSDTTLTNFKELLSTLNVINNKKSTEELAVHAYVNAWENSTRTNNLFNQELLVLLDDLSFSANEQSQKTIEKLIDITDAAFNQSKVFLDIALLHWMDKLQHALIETKLVGKVNGLPDIIKTVNRELQSGNSADFVLPNSSNAVAQTLLQYQSSHRPQDLWHFVTKDYQQSLLWLQMTSGDNQHMTKVVDWVKNYINQNPLPSHITYNWAGKSYINIIWQDEMVKGMAESLLSSFLIVFIMMVILFRSFKYGILAMLPLTFTITMIYGIIGWVGKAYDMPIAVLSALTLGLSIDFAIHFLQRVRELEKETQSLTTALTLMFNEPARAISRNAIVIAIGFTPLLLSPLMPYITVGVFLASIMVLSALVTLVLLPALMVLMHSTKTDQPQA